jgi:GNAT superfamily N-acetyltransferase
MKKASSACASSALEAVHLGLAMSNIRLAQPKDIKALVEGGVRMHQLTRFKNQPYNAQKIAQSFADLMNAGVTSKYLFLVAENGQGQIVGALIGLVEQQIFSDVLTASVMHFDVLPEARMGGYGVRLLKAFEQWAKNRHVFEITLGVNSGVNTETIGAFVKRMGYTKTGENYVK